MFIVRRNGRKFGRNRFKSYNEARQYVRQYIRRTLPEWILMEDVPGTSNPSIGTHGFSIERLT